MRGSWRRDGIGVPWIRKGLRMLAMYLSNWLAYSLGEAGTGVPGWKSAVHACVRDVVAFLGCLVWHGVILGWDVLVFQLCCCGFSCFLSLVTELSGIEVRNYAKGSIAFSSYIYRVDAEMENNICFGVVITS